MVRRAYEKEEEEEEQEVHEEVAQPVGSPSEENLARIFPARTNSDDGESDEENDEHGAFEGNRNKKGI